MKIEIGEDTEQKPLGIEGFEIAVGHHFEVEEVFAVAAGTVLDNSQEELALAAGS